MTTTPLTDAEVAQAVRERYAAAARSSLALDESACGCGDDCCGGPGRTARTTESAAAASCCATTCCDGVAAGATDPISADLYDATDVPSAGALAASLGCGNPTALADLQPGQDVLDLGSGGGLDVLLSARRVAPGGTAFGVDMTDEMLDLARRHQAESGVHNATFLKGTIEALPLPDASVDVVISNCVVNLSTDKDAVLAEAFRVLRPGGRFAVSDIVLLRPIGPIWTNLVGLWTGCIAGALLDTDYVARLSAVGFIDAGVEVTRAYTRDQLVELATGLTAADLPDGLSVQDAVDALDGAFASAFIRAIKPF